MAKRRSRRGRSAGPLRVLAMWLLVLGAGGASAWIWWRASTLAPPGEGSGVSPPAIAPPAAEPTRTPAATIPPALLDFPAPRAATNEGVSATPPPSDEKQVMTVQLALARRGISSGPIDGVLGSQTRAALRVYQRAEGLPVSGAPDDLTRRRLGGAEPTLSHYSITTQDLARLTPVPASWFGKSTRERLDYESVLELVSEKGHAHPRLIRQLNPGINWQKVEPGTVVLIPASELPAFEGKAGFVRISLSDKALRVFDSRSNLLAYFPCSIARKVDKRPVGELHVARLVPNPNYRFDPDIFSESEEARRIGRKLTIPPGPNNPVGTAWIGLDRPGYGIHGTPHPEDVGRTESHGCFRLANWNAEFLLKAAWAGMPVYVEP